MSRVEYTPRWPYPTTYLERGSDNPLTLGVYRDGAIVAPTSGTITVYDASNAAVVSAASVTPAGSLATYTIDAATLASSSLGVNWRIEWVLRMPDGYDHTYRTPAALVRVLLPPAASCETLLGLHPDLNNYLPVDITTNVRQTSWQPQLDTAWRFLLKWIESRGRRHYLTTTSDAFELLHAYEAMVIIARAQEADGDETGRWPKLEGKYEALAKEQRDTLVLGYDETDSGRATPGRRAAAQPPIFLTSRGRRVW